MSGGIDSTVASLMLHHEGYEVIGITMKTWDYTASGGGKKETGCCNLDSFNDARMAAVQHGFPHFILDIREEFGSFVVENFVDEYLAGRTPNPCVLCNTHIKWRALTEKSRCLRLRLYCHRPLCFYLSTFKRAVCYLQKVWMKQKTRVMCYGVWSKTCLSRTILPLGTYRKTEIRQMAHDFGYPELAKKSESYEICFVPDNDYRGFLKRKVEGLEESVAGGNFINKDGKILGQHKGYPFYTIGQRKGLRYCLGQTCFRYIHRPGNKYGCFRR